jgi:hypothetical protein
MKVKITVLALTLVLLLGLNLAPAQATSTPVYLGQTTWTGTITVNTSRPDLVGQSFTVTGGITRLGDTYYQFQGFVIPDDDDNPFIMSGGGVLINDKVIFSLATTQTHTDSNWHDTAVMQVTLNQSDLSGSLYEVGHDCDPTATPIVYGERYTAANLTRTGPAINLTPWAIVPSVSLLLLEE